MSARNPEIASHREWLRKTNGLGGFASSTITGLNTRRYHGLLCAALQPPSQRFMLLSKLEETLVVDGRRYELGVNSYPGAMHPTGYQYQNSFQEDRFPGICLRGAWRTLSSASPSSWSTAAIPS